MQNLMSFKTVIFLIVIHVFLLIHPANLILAIQEETKTGFSTELNNFDVMVRQSRQEMRKSCAIVQELIKQADNQKQDDGVAYIRQSIALWKKVQQKYQEKPPAEYQNDTKFGSRLNAILQGMQDMEKQLADGKFKEAFQFCSETCGLFVTMHEENGLVYAADRLFHLRKLVKKMIDEEHKAGLNPVKERLGELMKLRDNVLLVPYPAPNDEARYNNYQSTLKTLSAQLDDLVIQMVKGDQSAAENILKNLLVSINSAYGLAL